MRSCGARAGAAVRYSVGSQSGCGRGGDHMTAPRHLATLALLVAVALLTAAPVAHAQGKLKSEPASKEVFDGLAKIDRELNDFINKTLPNVKNGSENATVIEDKGNAIFSEFFTEVIDRGPVIYG